MKAAFKYSSFIIPNSSLLKAMPITLAERDETADVCIDLSAPSRARQAGAWVDESKTKIGYEINLNRYFYQYTPPRPLAEIEVDLKTIEKEIFEMLNAK